MTTQATPATLNNHGATPLTISEIQRLMAPAAAPCVSIFMPTHRDHVGAAEDPIRWKNLLGHAERLLSENYSSRDVQEVLAPLAEFGRPSFWRDQLDGLAVFRSRDVIKHYRVPMALPERVVVSPSFHIRPLIRFLQSNELFYVLALSRKQVTLYQGTSGGLSRVGTRDVPGSIEEALGPEVPGAQSTAHDSHGKAELVQFFRKVDERIWELLRDSHAPLVLAGVGYYHPLYRGISRYPHLLEQGLDGNFDKMNQSDLQTQAWAVVKQTFHDREEAALGEYHRLRGAGLANDDLEQVARAAVVGRVRLLMVARGTNCWGVLDRETGSVERRETQQDAADDDVLDDLAEAVLARGGEVLVLARERMPDESPLAAVLRW